MRSVSCLHFSLILMKLLTVLVAALALSINGNIPQDYFLSTLFFIATHFVAFTKPYQRPCNVMNYVEALLLLLVTLLCYTQSLEAVTMFEDTTSLTLCRTMIILIHVTKICDTTMTALKFCTSNLRLCFVEKTVW